MIIEDIPVDTLLDAEALLSPAVIKGSDKTGWLAWSLLNNDLSSTIVTLEKSRWSCKFDYRPSWSAHRSQLQAFVQSLQICLASNLQ